MGRPSQKVVVAAAFVAAMFLNILDATIVNVALPSIATAFGAEPTEAEWVVLGYLLSLAVFIPASGWIGDRVGTKRTFLVAVALFTVASVLCGLAGSLGQLVAFRLLQGAGGGMLMPVGTAMLFRAFPPSERAAASRVIIVPTVMAPALGPVIGGLLLHSLSWRWIFFVNVPVGVAVVVGGALLLQEHREPDAGRFDLAGFVLSGAGLALLLYALSRGADAGWGSPVIVATALGGVIVIATLVVVELRTPEPMLHLRLFGDRLFRSTNLACFFGFGAFLAMLFAASLFVQSGQGLSALDAGLATFPEAVGVLCGSQVAARLYPASAPPADDRRAGRAGARAAGAVRARLRHQPVDPASPGVRRRVRHGLHVHAAPGRHLRQDHPGRHGPGLGPLQHAAPDGRGGGRGGGGHRAGVAGHRRALVVGRALPRRVPGRGRHGRDRRGGGVDGRPRRGRRRHDGAPAGAGRVLARPGRAGPGQGTDIGDGRFPARDPGGQAMTTRCAVTA